MTPRSGGEGPEVNNRKANGFFAEHARGIQDTATPLESESER